MKYFDVFDKHGDWVDTEVYPDDFPDELVQTNVRSKSVHGPDVWVQSTDLTEAGITKARIEYTPSLQEGPCCAFCGRHKKDVPTLVESAVDPSKAVCGDCITKLKGRH